jgi:hypothetical protein
VGNPRGLESVLPYVAVIVRRLPVALVLTTALTFAPGATAKDFRPGDLRICNAKHCVAITDQNVLNVLSVFYYSGPQPARTPAPRMGAPAFQLKFTNGYVTGIVASARLNRFLSYGVYLGRFRKGAWYRVPDRAARELIRLTESLKPMRVTPAALRKSH